MHKIAAAALVCALAASQTAAQSPFGGLTGKPANGGSALGGLGLGGGLTGGLMPDVSSVGVGNAAGVVGYCIKNKYLGADGAASVLGRLTGRSDVTSSSGYSAGQGGLLQLGGGKSFSLDSVKGQMKTKMCDLVLNHAKSLL